MGGQIKERGLHADADSAPDKTPVWKHLYK